MTALTGAEHNARDDTFMAHFYGMFELQLQIGGRLATTEERANLHEHFPLNAHAQHLIGLGEDLKLPEDEDINTHECSEAEPEQYEEEVDEDAEQGDDDEDWAAGDSAFYDESFITTLLAFHCFYMH